jgi:hypothetical protein
MKEISTKKERKRDRYAKRKRKNEIEIDRRRWKKFPSNARAISTLV